LHPHRKIPTLAVDRAGMCRIGVATHDQTLVVVYLAAALGSFPRAISARFPGLALLARATQLGGSRVLPLPRLGTVILDVACGDAGQMDGVADHVRRHLGRFGSLGIRETLR